MNIHSHPLRLSLRGLAAVFFWGLVFGGNALQMNAASPGWWSERGILETGGTVDDFAAVNQGQVKNLAKAAIGEMDAKLPGGAGEALHALSAGWSVPNPLRDDYATVNQGQLKALAKLFYDRLIEVGYATTYPWTLSTTDDDNYAAANIGQAKYLFSFDLSNSSQPVTDNDADGLPDDWEMEHFGNLATNPNGDSDGDSLTNMEEYQQGNDPNDYYSQGSVTITPILSIVSGNGQGDLPGTTLTQPMVVKLTDGQGMGYANAPVTFAMNSGSGVLTPLNGGRTDGNGFAQAALQLPISAGTAITVTATTGSPGHVVQVVFTASVGNPGVVPAAPANLRSTKNPDGSTDFTWDDLSDNETYFFIERQQPDGTWGRLFTAPANTTSYHYVPPVP